MPKLGRADDVAGVDDMLHVADEMREADLIVRGRPVQLPAAETQKSGRKSPKKSARFGVCALKIKH
jgi:hypothetical protein